MRRSNKWDDTFYVRSYQLARDGYKDASIAQALGVIRDTFARWVAERPALAQALKDGRKRTNSSSFTSYVYNHLSPAVKEVWDKITLAEQTTIGYEKIEHILSESGMRMRQQLFVHALIAANFNASEACRKVNISKDQLDHWVDHDPLFADLIEELHWHKGNFFESALCDLVAEGSEPATIFANKTFNRKRGYGESSTLKVEGTINHEHSHLHAHVSLDQLDLPLDVRRSILEAVRRTREALPAKQIPQLVGPIAQES